MTDIPKQDLLLKLLKMTTSDNDSESLVALRKANALLVSAGWDWEKLITGKIIVVEDPFKGLADPPPNRWSTNGHAPPPPTNTGSPPPRAPAPPKPPPPPPLRGTPLQPLSSASNKFVGYCYCCGIECVAHAGFIFKAKKTDAQYSVVCTSCNTSAQVPMYPAAKQRGTKKNPLISDLA